MSRFARSPTTGDLTVATDDAGPGAAQALADVVRREWSQVVATLVGVTGDLGFAEDAVQDAAVEAMSAWADEIPERPGAWILTVARRRAIDRIRREATGRRKAELLGRLEAWNTGSVNDPAEDVTGQPTALRDDQLRLVFGCCHPALNAEARAALTLRSVGGLTTLEIARGFLVPEATMAQRLVRAKRKIAAAAIPFVLPRDSELLERLDVVHRVIYLIFNEGYAASSGGSLVRADLCLEAIRLARLLAGLVPDDAETLALLALLLATNARRLARADDDGVPILLADQDRTLWNASEVSEAEALLDRALRLRAGGPLQLQAAIAVLHDQAGSAAETDWEQIELLYRRLEVVQPTPVVTLNRAVALAMGTGWQAGLEALDEPALARELDNYRYFHAARAHLLAEGGRRPEAIAAYDRAIVLTDSAPETALLLRKRADVVLAQIETG